MSVFFSLFFQPDALIPILSPLSFPSPQSCPHSSSLPPAPRRARRAGDLGRRGCRGGRASSAGKGAVGGRATGGRARRAAAATGEGAARRRRRPGQARVGGCAPVAAEEARPSARVGIPRWSSSGCGGGPAERGHGDPTMELLRRLRRPGRARARGSHGGAPPAAVPARPSTSLCSLPLSLLPAMAGARPSPSLRRAEEDARALRGTCRMVRTSGTDTGWEPDLNDSGWLSGCRCGDFYWKVVLQDGFRIAVRTALVS